MPRFLPVLLALLLLSLSQRALALDIVATTTDLASIARAVGGDDVVVDSLVSGTSDPHYAAAKPSMIRRVHDADLLILIGADFEVGWLPAVLQAARNGDVQPGQTGYLDLSHTVSLRDVPVGEVSRAQGDVHASGNPHYWLDPRNGKRIAGAIADRLASLDPDNRAQYRERLAAFNAELDSRIPAWRTGVGGLSGRPVIAYHKSFVYLAAALGFDIVDQVEPLPGISPSASHLNDLISRIERERIELLIMESYYERRSAEFLHARTGIRVAVIPHSVGSEANINTYFDLFDAIVDALSEPGSS
ncbi:MAG: ABC transporter substrate-binding protein [Rhodospirillaceae bacterium]|nr:ABC transporter substrate-binding protein [Rhodospirillaceae bacterium]|tara:strand:- start:22 stop:930 length:909 start_codon:yes stop_codon:yes gene_type:complete